MERDTLLRMIDLAYGTRAWHGTTLRGSLRRVDAARAAWRPAPGRHNIWELVVHAAYWKYVVRRRLLDEPHGSFPLVGSNWFARPDEEGARAWRDDVALLDEMHRTMRAAVAGLDPATLGDAPEGSDVTRRDLVIGVASHDVYHTGQIQLLKRLAPAG